MVKPQLALSYNHLAGNGLAGVGWGLSGISSITRCQRTHAQDGLTVSFRYTSDDVYCLDGSRLIAVAGTYGAHGTEYRTEIESFQRVYQNGTVGATGAQSFYVQHGDGRTSYYGYTTDSRVEAAGTGQTGVRIWYLSYTQDQFGNRISYVYDENTTTGEAVPTEVHWTSNAGQGLSARYKIVITYETRPADDQRFGYDMGGSKWASTKRINKIDVVYNGSTTKATYDLTYGTPSATGTGRSQLAQVTLCRGNDCLPASVFTTQSGTRGWNASTNTSRSIGAHAMVGDMDGDGRQDIFVSLSGTWQVYRGRADGGLEAALNSGFSSATNPHRARVWDYNGDGRDDLLYHGTSTRR